MHFIQHPVPSAAAIIGMTSVAPHIVRMTTEYRAVLDRYYKQDIAAIQQHTESIKCQRTSIKLYEMVER